MMQKIDILLFQRLTKRRERRNKKRIKLKQKKSKAQPIKIIKIPQIMDFNENIFVTLEFIDKLRNTLLSSKKVIIDHTQMEFITKEALLVLVAEIERCTSAKNGFIRGNKKYMPKNEYINFLLNKIGYWRYFNIRSPKYNYEENRLFLSIRSDIKANARYIAEVLRLFEELVYFEGDVKDKFNDALFEAIANTVEHGYIEEQDIPVIKNKWWFTASLNRDTNEISFTIYDQGIGIFKSLVSHNRKKPIPDAIKGLIDKIDFIDKHKKKKILSKLLTTDLSRHKKTGRGRGFKTFKNFIDEVEDGELIIVTDDISYYTVADNVLKSDFPLNGTLISWKIKVDYDQAKNIHLKEKT